MSRLPKEILREIFLYLHQNDKIECMLASRFWKQILEEGPLYQTVCIYSEKGLKKLAEKIKRKPHIAKKVERLLLFSEDLRRVDLIKYLPLLPNLHTVYGPVPHEILVPTGREARHNFKHISNSPMAYVLFYLSCPNLVTLSLHGVAGRALILDALKNAPNLKSLNLAGCWMSFNKLDSLHKSLPQLSSINLPNMDFMDCELNTSAIPALGITECSFSIELFRNKRMQAEFLKYISIKYPSLTKITHNYFGIIDGSQDLVEDAWTPVFEKLGPQLESLLVDDHDFYGALDKYNCRIKHLKLEDTDTRTCLKLAQSQQIYYIQTLVLNNLRQDEFLCGSWLKEFKVLKKLKITGDPHYYPFRRTPILIRLRGIVINAPQTLRWLSLGDASLGIDFDYTGQSNIETLSFDSLELPKSFDTFLSRYFPKLVNLKLLRCDLNGQTFNLLKMNLFRLRFSAQREGQARNYILVSTLNNNEMRWYSVAGVSFDYSRDKKVEEFYRPVKSWSADMIETGPFFTLICNSLQNVSFIV